MEIWPQYLQCNVVDSTSSHVTGASLQMLHVLTLVKFGGIFDVDIEGQESEMLLDFILEVGRQGVFVREAMSQCKREGTHSLCSKYSLNH